MIKKKSFITILIALAILFVFIPGMTESTYAASVKLNKKSVTIDKGKTAQLKVKGTKAKVTIFKQPTAYREF